MPTVSRPIPVPHATLAEAEELQRVAWREIRYAMAAILAQPDAGVDRAELLRAALAEYVTAERMLIAAKGRAA